MINNNTTRTNFLSNYNKTDALLIVGTGTVGAIGGIAKTHFMDKPAIDYNLKYVEYDKYVHAVEQNEKTILDKVELAAKNKKLKDDFNNFCDYCYHDGIKKINKKNVLIGSAIGLVVGAIGVFAKHILQKRKQNENNSDSISNEIQKK